MSGLQKNPRRAKCLTGIYAINSKLKYGVRSLGSTVLVFCTTKYFKFAFMIFLVKILQKVYPAHW